MIMHMSSIVHDHAYVADACLTTMEFVVRFF